jgi:hypothetical protein
MRRTLQSAGRTLTGGRPGLSVCVVGAAATTAALQSSGVDGWWALPLLVVALLTSRLRRGR